MKRLFTLAFVLASILTFAQRPTNNPFSRFGVGELMFQGFGQNIATGHTGIASYSSFHFSKLNPASYTALGKQHVIFTFGFSEKLNQFQTQDSSIYSNISDMTHIAGAFPVNNWLFLSFGVTPYSGVGYHLKITDTATAGESSTVYSSVYDGSGGINEFYFGAAAKPIKNLSLGYNAYFRWGTFNRDSYIYVDESDFDESSSFYYTLIHHGFAMDFGAIWADTIFNKEDRNVFSYSIGATYSPASTLTGLEKRIITKHTSYLSISFNDTLVNDTIMTYQLPLASSLGLGFSFTVWDQFRMELNYSRQNWKGLEVLDMSSLLRNSQLFAMGMEYCKDPYSSKYLNTVRFRFGAYLNQTYLVLNNTPINQYGVTIGFGFPARQAIINTSVEFSTKGTLENNLFKENYILFNLDLTMHDIWFIKRKFL